MVHSFENDKMSTSFSLLNWNVNGLRSRIEQLAEIIELYDPDIITLQEIKCDLISGDEVFKRIKELGYSFIISCFPEKTHLHGVATLYKSILIDIPEDIIYIKEGRVLSCDILGVTIVNNYINQGREVGHEEYTKKLELFQALNEQVKIFEQVNKLKICLAGDFNVMPDDIDVWDTDKWHNGVVGCTDFEKNCFKLLVNQNKLINLEPVNLPRMTWYNYKTSWRKYKNGVLADKTEKYGIKCDHILVKNISAELKLLTEERFPINQSETATSDHVPMLVNLKVEND